MICHECKGAKVLHGFGCPGFRPTELPCPLCKATGEITLQRYEWIKKGQLMRKARIRAGRGIRDAARDLGVKPSELSDMEHGVIEPRVEPK